MILDNLFPEIEFNNEHSTVVMPQEGGPALKPRGSSFQVFSLLSFGAAFPGKWLGTSVFRLVSVGCVSRETLKCTSFLVKLVLHDRQAGVQILVRLSGGARFLSKVPFLILEKPTRPLILCHLPFIQCLR